MTKEEIKLQCLRMACEILGISQASYACMVDGKLSNPSVYEVLAGAEKLFDWVIKKEAGISNG